jgi:carbonic anhydrase
MHRHTLLAAALLALAADPARAQSPAAADTCPSDSQQSPIDIRHPIPSSVPVVSARYPTRANVRLTNLDSQEVKVLVPAGVATLRLGSVSYLLEQFHTHWPSEHRLGGIQFPAEIHFVHGAGGTTVAVGLLVNWSPGDVDNPAWAPLLDRIPAPGDTVTVNQVELARLLQTELLGREQVFHYAGSLTTPNYTPVRWLVRARPLLLSSRQIGQLRAATGRYSRDLQRLCSIVRRPLPRR